MIMKKILKSLENDSEHCRKRYKNLKKEEKA